MQDMWTKEKLGQTQDDAAGEAFDKVAKMMWLGYPGGPIISKYASAVCRWSGSRQLFPRVFLEKSEFWFSFSGLKSAVKREVDKRWELSARWCKRTIIWISSIGEWSTYHINFLMRLRKKEWKQ